MLSTKEPQKEKIKRVPSSSISTNVPWEVIYSFPFCSSSVILKHWKELKIIQTLPISWMLLLINENSGRDVVLRLLLGLPCPYVYLSMSIHIIGATGGYSPFCNFMYLHKHIVHVSSFVHVHVHTHTNTHRDW